MWIPRLSYSFVSFWFHLYHCTYGCMYGCMSGCMFYVLLFNFVNYVFLLSCMFCFTVLFCVLFVCKCVLYCTVLYCTVLYCTVLYYTVLYCTALYVWRNTEEPSCNHCCSEKSSKYYILWVCVCSLRYPACNAHAPCCHLWPVSLRNISPHYPIKGTIFGKNLLNIKWVLILYVNCVWENSYYKKNWARCD